MEFCSACGSRLVPKKVVGSNLLLFICTKCDKTVKKNVSSPSELAREINHSPKQFIAVIEKTEDINILPTIDVECPRCGNNRAFVWQVQIRGNDESSTQFMRCTKCDFTFRENS